MTIERVAGAGVSQRVSVEGRGVPVLLLHGFPDSLDMWRNQVPALVDAGFRTIAPDLRGFGESDRPSRVADYLMPRVVEDLKSVLDRFDVPRAHVVGHDWGAIAGWGLAGWAPERVDRLVAISVGHPRSFVRALARQAWKSWYAGFFQLPRVPEAAIRARDWALFRRLFGGSRDFDRYLSDLARPGALTAGLNWYRANGRPDRLMRYPPVAGPALGIWGRKDWALGERQMTASERYVRGGWRYERLDGGHWLPLSRPGEINRLLLGFLSGGMDDA
jgi:pimeloyl-ACP methyl ester carboxylesterase